MYLTHPHPHINNYVFNTHTHCTHTSMDPWTYNPRHVCRRRKNPEAVAPALSTVALWDICGAWHKDGCQSRKQERKNKMHITDIVKVLHLVSQSGNGETSPQTTETILTDISLNFSCKQNIYIFIYITITHVFPKGSPSNIAHKVKRN